jgi:predicted kinase
MAQVTMTVGCPGAGKTTLGRQHLERHPLALQLQLDDFRCALFGSKKRYWRAPEETRRGWSRVLHDTYGMALDAALCLDHELFLSNTHVHLPTFERDLATLRAHAVSVDVLMLDVPLDVLIPRNLAREGDEHIQEETTRQYHAALTAPDAWWRRLEDHLPLARLRTLRWSATAGQLVEVLL